MRLVPAGCTAVNFGTGLTVEERHPNRDDCREWALAVASRNQDERFSILAKSGFIDHSEDVGQDKYLPVFENESLTLQRALFMPHQLGHAANLVAQFGNQKPAGLSIIQFL
jgi:hypothetical protein